MVCGLKTTKQVLDDGLLAGVAGLGLRTPSRRSLNGENSKRRRKKEEEEESNKKEGRRR